LAENVNIMTSDTLVRRTGSCPLLGQNGPIHHS